MRRWIVPCLWVLAGCAGNPEPATPLQVITPLSLEPPPIYALLGHRQDLNLTSAQITQLDSIAESTREANAALVEGLRTRARERASRNRSGVLQVDEETAPLLERVRASHRRAAEAVRAVLSDEQQATTCRLFGEQRRLDAEQRGSATRDRRARRGRQGVPADTVGGWSGRSVWPWCDQGAKATTPG